MLSLSVDSLVLGHFAVSSGVWVNGNYQILRILRTRVG